MTSNSIDIVQHCMKYCLPKFSTILYNICQYCKQSCLLKWFDIDENCSKLITIMYIKLYKVFGGIVCRIAHEIYQYCSILYETFHKIV